VFRFRFVVMFCWRLRLGVVVLPSDDDDNIRWMTRARGRTLFSYISFFSRSCCLCFVSWLCRVVLHFLVVCRCLGVFVVSRSSAGRLSFSRSFNSFLQHGVYLLCKDVLVYGQVLCFFNFRGVHVFAINWTCVYFLTILGMCIHVPLFSPLLLL